MGARCVVIIVFIITINTLQKVSTTIIHHYYNLRVLITEFKFLSPVVKRPLL